MKQVNNIQISVFCPPEENQEAVKETFLKFIGYSLDEIKKEKIYFKEKNAKGFQERKIKMLSCTLQKDRHCNKFLKELNEHICDKDKKDIISQSNRLDDNLNFYLRFDKNKLLTNEFKITDSGDCFHIKMNLAVFPKNRNDALLKIKEIFD